MSKEGVRKQSLAELHERRKQVIRLHLKGHKVMRIVELTGLSWPTVRGAIDRYEAVCG
jgi:transposase